MFPFIVHKTVLISNEEDILTSYNMSDGIINVLFLKSHATFCGNLIMQATIHNTLLTADRVELQPKD